MGGTKSIIVDVRIIAATNRDLDQSVRVRTFREDLYHRLNVIAITLPPLRERKEDIPILANYFLQRFSSEAKKNFSEIAASLHEKLLAYRWPGNVRELANVIERAVVLGDGPVLTVHHLPARVIGGQPMNKIEELSYQEAINTYRRELIVSALATAQGNRAAGRESSWLAQNSSAENHESPFDQLKDMTITTRIYKEVFRRCVNPSGPTFFTPCS